MQKTTFQGNPILGSVSRNKSGVFLSAFKFSNGQRETFSHWSEIRGKNLSPVPEKGSFLLSPDLLLILISRKMLNENLMGCIDNSLWALALGSKVVSIWVCKIQNHVMDYLVSCNGVKNTLYFIHYYVLFIVCQKPSNFQSS